MAINLNVDKYGAVQQGGTYGGFLSAKKRTLDEKNANNAVRTARPASC